MKEEVGQLASKMSQYEHTIISLLNTINWLSYDITYRINNLLKVLWMVGVCWTKVINDLVRPAIEITKMSWHFSTDTMSR